MIKNTSIRSQRLAVTENKNQDVTKLRMSLRQNGFSEKNIKKALELSKPRPKKKRNQLFTKSAPFFLIQKPRSSWKSKEFIKLYAGIAWHNHPSTAFSIHLLSFGRLLLEERINYWQRVCTFLAFLGLVKISKKVRPELPSHRFSTGLTTTMSTSSISTCFSCSSLPR